MSDQQESKKRKMGERESDADKTKRLQAGPRHSKMLVHNHVAGTIIGTGGVVLQELENTTGACIRLSRPGVTFPGTSERILVAGGTLEAVQDLLRKVVEKQLAAAAEQGTEPNVGMNTLRVILPNSSVSSVIGRGGEVVREIQQETGARVSVGDRVPGFQERICIIKGTLEQMLAAGNSVMDKIKDDDNVSSAEFLDVFNVGTPAPANSGSGGGGPPPPSQQQHFADQQQQIALQQQQLQHATMAANAAQEVNNASQSRIPSYGHQFSGGTVVTNTSQYTTNAVPVSSYDSSFVQQQQQQQQAAAAAAAAAAQTYPPAPHRAIYATVPPEIFEKNATITMQVPDQYVAGVYGKDHALIREMGAKTSCVMTFLDENVPGKMQRTLEISGPLQNVHVAHALVLKRVAELELQFAYPPVGAIGMDPQGYGQPPPQYGQQFVGQPPMY